MNHQSGYYENNLISFEFKTNVKIRIPPPFFFLNCTFLVLKPHSYPQDFLKYMNIMFRIT